MGLRAKFFLAFLSCTLITLAVVVFSLFSMRRIGGMADTMALGDVRIVEYANLLAGDLAGSRLAEKEFFLMAGRDKRQLAAMVRWRKAYARMRDRHIPMLETLYREAGDTAALAGIARVRQLMKENVTAFDAFTASFRKTGSYARAQRAGYGEFVDRTHDIEDIVRGLCRESLARVRDRWHGLSSAGQESGFILQAAFVLALAWGLLLASVFGGRVSRAISRLARVADDIGQGRLGGEIRMRRRDEIGRLAAALERVRESMRFLMERAGRAA